MKISQFKNPGLSLSKYIIRSETNQRENNEDSFLVCDLYLTTERMLLKVLAIADGMGGYEHGELVSQETLRRVSLALFEQLCVIPAMNTFETDRTFSNDTIIQALWTSIEQASTYVRRMVQLNNWGKAGSTVVIVVIVGNTAIVANLGDSPLFHYQASGKKFQKITEDHTVAGVLLRAGKISPEMAIHHEGHSRLEFFVGAETFPRKAPVYTFPLASDDLLLLCTDGVTGTLPFERIEEIVSGSQQSLETIARELFEAARGVGESDNQTLILWQNGTPNATAIVEPNTPDDNKQVSPVSIPSEEIQKGAATSEMKGVKGSDEK